MDKLCSLLFCFFFCVQLAAAQVRFVSLVPGAETSFQFGNCRQELSYLENSKYLNLEGGVYSLQVSVGGEESISKRLGFGRSERAIIVALGNPGFSPSAGFFHKMKARFEGQGHAFKENYAVQATVLRGSAYLDPTKAYLRILHGATATVPLTIHCGSQKTSLKYAQATDFLPVEPGEQEVEISPQDTSAPLLTRTLNLPAGTITYLMLARDDRGKGKLGTLVFTDSRSEPTDR